MQEFVTLFSGLGVTGVIAYKLFEVFLKEKEQDKIAYREELREQREMYKEELAKDREVYINSINSVVNRLENVEQDVEEIKNLIKK